MGNEERQQGKGRAPPAARDSKKPLETVSRGQLSSLRMGCGGSSRRASGCRPARSSATSSGASDSSIRAASSSRSCVAAVTYASAPWPVTHMHRSALRKILSEGPAGCRDDALTRRCLGLREPCRCARKAGSLEACWTQRMMLHGFYQCGHQALLNSSFSRLSADGR